MGGHERGVAHGGGRSGPDQGAPAARPAPYRAAAGTALVAGSGGTALFGALGLLAPIPMLVRSTGGSAAGSLRRWSCWSSPPCSPCPHLSSARQSAAPEGASAVVRCPPWTTRADTTEAIEHPRMRNIQDSGLHGACGPWEGYLAPPRRLSEEPAGHRGPAVPVLRGDARRCWRGLARRSRQDLLTVPPEGSSATVGSGRAPTRSWPRSGLCSADPGAGRATARGPKTLMPQTRRDDSRSQGHLCSPQAGRKQR